MLDQRIRPAEETFTDAAFADAGLTDEAAPSEQTDPPQFPAPEETPSSWCQTIVREIGRWRADVTK